MTTPAVAPAPPRNVWPWCFLFLAALPLFFINIRPDQDWGDDFAMYLMHARNLAEGRPYAETGYVFDPTVSCFGPGVYPPGFPLVLAPVFAFTGVDVVAAQYVITLCLLVLGLACFTMFRSLVPPGIACLMVLGLWYNPWVLTYKSRVLSDIPFAMWFVLAWLALHSPKPRVQATLLFLLPMLTLTRTVGWTIPMAMFSLALMRGPVNAVFRTIRIPAPALYAKPLHWFGLIFWTLGTHRLVEGLLDAKAVGSNADYLTTRGLPWILAGNMRAYAKDFHDFVPSHPSIPLLSWMMVALAIGFMALGAVSRLRRFGLLEMLVGLNLMLLLAWPCTQGIRFLLPLLPFFWIIFLEGCLLFRRGSRLAAVFFICLLGVGLLENLASKIRKGFPQSGPFQPEAMDMFHAVKRLTEAEAQVDFFKPRAMALYGERRSRVLRKDRPVADNPPGPFYLVTMGPAEALGEALWSNDRFFLYAGHAHD